MRCAALGVALGATALLFSFAPDARAACTGRPTDAGYPGAYAYGSASTKSHATAQVRVHWATTGTHTPDLASTRADGVPDTVAYAADVAEDALTRYAELGFRKIPSDAGCASNGGDEKVDVYLVGFTAGDGSTTAECVGASCSSFALVDATFSGRGYADPQEGFRTVVTHELFHAVQNTYKRGDAPFWAEGTAQWAVKTLHPGLPDFERSLPEFFTDTSHSIDAPPTGPAAAFLYGSAVWPLFLSLSYGPTTIREVFELEGEGKDALPAIDAVLQRKGSSLADAFPVFAAWNAGTGKIASSGGYPDAAKYPGVKTTRLADGVSAITSGLGYFVYRGTLDEPSQIALETDAARNAGVVVPIEGGTAQLDRLQKLPANAEGEVLVVVAGVTTKKTDGPFTVRLLPPAAEPPTPTPTPTAAAASGDDGCSAAPRSTSRMGLVLGMIGAAALALRSRRRPV